MGDDWLNTLVGRVLEEAKTTEEIFKTKADVMLRFSLIEQPNLLEMGLSCRERLTWTENERRIDILAFSGILLPEYTKIGEISFTNQPRYARDIQYGERFVDREELIDNLYSMFSIIRGYERQKIHHPVSYRGGGAGRLAHVSVTELDKLRKFHIFPLHNTPDVYHTEDTKEIILPSKTIGEVTKMLKGNTS